MSLPHFAFSFPHSPPNLPSGPLGPQLPPPPLPGLTLPLVPCRWKAGRKSCGSHMTDCHKVPYAYACAAVMRPACLLPSFIHVHMRCLSCSKCTISEVHWRAGEQPGVGEKGGLKNSCRWLAIHRLAILSCTQLRWDVAERPERHKPRVTMHSVSLAVLVHSRG